MTSKRYRRVILEEEEVSSGILDGSNCPKCEAELYIDGNFCHVCGAQTQKSCEKCGVIMPGSAWFCMKCGDQLFSKEEDLQNRLESLRLAAAEKDAELAELKSRFGYWRELVDFAGEENVRKRIAEYEEMREERNNLMKLFHVDSSGITFEQKKIIKYLDEFRQERNKIRKFYQPNLIFRICSQAKADIYITGSIEVSESKKKFFDKMISYVGVSAPRFSISFENMHPRFIRIVDESSEFCITATKEFERFLVSNSEEA